MTSGVAIPGRNFYPQNGVASVTTPYKVAKASPSGNVQSDLVITCVNAAEYFYGEGYITDPGVPAVTSLPAGTAYRDLYALISATASPVGQIRSDLVRYQTTGNVATTGAVSFTYVENGAGNRDTITRAAGSFLLDGFTDGCRITVTGTALNDGTYTVWTVAALTLTLVINDDLAAETVSSTITTKEKTLRSGTSEQFTNSTVADISWSYSDANSYAFAVDDRIVFKWYAQRVSGGNAATTVTISTEGTTSQSFIKTTLPIV